MQIYEYIVVPAPNRSKRVKGVKGTAGRFAAVLTETMNELAAEGWEYLRSDSLPVEEKPGLLKSRVETYQTVLVFRRAMPGVVETPMAGYIEDQTDIIADTPEPEPEADAAPEDVTPEPEAPNEPELPTEPSVSPKWADDADYPSDPPLTSRSEDSPFAQPQNGNDDPATR